MKKMKKLILSVFALSAMLLSACSGGGSSSSSSQSSSSSASSESTSATSSSESSQSSSGSSESSSQESSSEESSSESSESSESSSEESSSESSESSSSEADVGYKSDINGVIQRLENVKPEGSTDKAKFIIELESTDELKIKLDGEYLDFYSWSEGAKHNDGKVYTAVRDGEYTVWHNADGELWVDAPVEPVAPGFYLRGENIGEDWSIDPDYKLKQGEGEDATKFSIDYDAVQGDVFKICEVKEDGTQLWYPYENADEQVIGSYKSGEDAPSAIYKGYLNVSDGYNMSSVVPGKYFIEIDTVNDSYGIWTSIKTKADEHDPSKEVELVDYIQLYTQPEEGDPDYLSLPLSKGSDGKYQYAFNNLALEYARGLTLFARWNSESPLKLSLLAGADYSKYFTLDLDNNSIAVKTDASAVVNFRFVLSEGKVTFVVEELLPVTFYVQMPDNNPFTYVAGSFNNWEIGMGIGFMQEVDSDRNIFAGTVYAPEGQHEFKFVSGELEFKDEEPIFKYVWEDLGVDEHQQSINRTITVEEKMSTQVYKFGSKDIIPMDKVFGTIGENTFGLKDIRESNEQNYGEFSVPIHNGETITVVNDETPLKFWLDEEHQDEESFTADSDSYFNFFYSKATGKIHVTKGADLPDTNEYSFSIPSKEGRFVLEKDTETEKQYVISRFPVEAGDVLSFYINDKPTDKFSYDENEGNNLDEDMKILEGGYVDIYLKTSDNTVWVSMPTVYYHFDTQVAEEEGYHYIVCSWNDAYHGVIEFVDQDDQVYVLNNATHFYVAQTTAETVEGIIWDGDDCNVINMSRTATVVENELNYIYYYEYQDGEDKVYVAANREIPVIFTVDMKYQTVEDPTKVYIAGLFTNWEKVAMSKSGESDVYYYEFELPCATFEYKFVNGDGEGSWETINNRKISIDLGHDEFNSYFNDYAPALITFNVDINDAGFIKVHDYDKVFIAGDFNSWSTMTDKMSEIDDTGVYTITKLLEPGEHEFKFVCGGYEFSGNNRKINVTKEATYDFVYGESDFYVVGIINGKEDWQKLSNDYKMTRISNQSDVYMIDLDLKEGDSFKVVRVNSNGKWEWHGYYISDEKYDENYTVTKDGKYSIYFGYSWLHIDVEEKNTNTYCIVGDANGWDTSDQTYALTLIDHHFYQIKGFEAEEGEKFKLFSSPEGEWYTNTKAGYDYTIDGDGNIVFSQTGSYEITFYLDWTDGNYVQLVKE